MKVGLLVVRVVVGLLIAGLSEFVGGLLLALGLLAPLASAAIIGTTVNGMVATPPGKGPLAEAIG